VNLIWKDILKNKESESTVTERYKFEQNFPNPFNSMTNIWFQVTSSKFVKLAVYDILGRKVRVLVNEIKSPGRYIVSFDASELSSGIYVYRIETNNFSETRKIILMN